MQFLREKLTEIFVLVMLWLLGWDGARKNPCAWSSAVVLPTLKKKKGVSMLADSFIRLKKEEQIFTEHSIYARSMYKCKRSKIQIWVNHGPCVQRDPWHKFWTGIYFQHATAISYFDYILHTWLCSTQHECPMVIEL